MQEINLNVLKDKALDVDPDLRFMALEDFRKYLGSSKRSHSSDRSGSQISEFVPSLFRLLEDQNPDVQSQAVKTFEPTIRFLDDSGVVSMIARLYECVLTEHDKFINSNIKVKRFTTSIPNMALRSIFNGSETTTDNSNKELVTPIFDAKVSRSILDRLLPQLSVNEVTFDSIEIFIDLIKNLGYVLTEQELFTLTTMLINIAFKETGIVSKRSLNGLEYLFAYVKNPDVVNAALKQVFESNDNVAIKYNIFSIAFESGVAIDESLVSQIYTDVYHRLNLGDSEAGELDYDKLLENNLIRENCLSVLDSLINSRNSIDVYKDNILTILQYFATYNPLNNDDDMDFDDEYDDDIQFSDDENDNDDDEEDDGSWKLRYKSAIIVRSYLKKLPQSLDDIYSGIFSLLPIDDKNELVTNEVIKTLIFIVDATEVKNVEKFSQLEAKLVNKISIKEKVNQLPRVLKLIESLNRFKETKLIVATFTQMEKLQLIGSLNYSNFYKNVLENSAGDPLPAFIVSYIANDLIVSINDKSFSVIMESIKVFSLLLGTNNVSSITIEQSELAVDNLIIKVENLKTYSGDIVQLAITCLGSLISHGFQTKLEPIALTFQRCLVSENTTRTILEVLAGLALSNNRIFELQEFQAFLLGKLESLIFSTDESIQTLALTCLGSLVSNCPVNLDDATIQPLISSLNTISASGLSLIFEIFRSLVAKNGFTETYGNTLLSSFKQLIDDKKIDINDASFFSLLKSLVVGKPDLFGSLYATLDLKSPLSAKVLAVVSVENQLTQEIENREAQLIDEAENRNINLLTVSSSLLFNIQYLGSVAEQAPLKNITVEVIVKLLRDNDDDSDKPKTTSVDDKDLTNNSADVIKNAIATTVGSIVQRDINGQLSILLAYYENPTYIKSRNYLVTSLKSVLSAASDEQIDSIWKSVWMGVSSIQFTHAVCGELRNSGDLLSRIVLRKPQYIIDFVSTTPILADPASKLSVTYTMSVLIKHLVSHIEDGEQTKNVLDSLLFASIDWLSILNIDLKQIIIGNLLTYLHNKPGIILPHLSNEILSTVYQQLKAEEEFKSVIQMGPYKFVIDEGLEIRKLSYEFLYAIGSLSTKILEKYNIDLVEIATNIINQGLVDDQIDIVILSCINLTNISNNHESAFKSLLIIHDHSISNSILSNLKIQLNKKLSAKASAQDTETYENRIRAIVKFSKRAYELVNQLDSENLGKSPDLVTNWSSYVAYLTESFPKFYNGVDLTK